MSEYGKRVVIKQAGKMSQSGHFVTNPGKKEGSFVTAALHPPLGLGGRKSQDVSSGEEMSQWT
jgi:hypothetical protein